MAWWSRRRKIVPKLKINGNPFEKKRTWSKYSDSTSESHMEIDSGLVKSVDFQISSIFKEENFLETMEILSSLKDN